MSHSSPFVRSVFVVSLQSCNSNFIGYNVLFGSRQCKSYSSDDAMGQLIREIRSTHHHIPNFSPPELNAIVLSVLHNLLFCMFFYLFVLYLYWYVCHNNNNNNNNIIIIIILIILLIIINGFLCYT